MPLIPTDEQVSKATDVYNATLAWACDLGMNGFLAEALAGLAGGIVLAGSWLFSVVLTVYVGLFGPFFDALLKAIDTARQAVDPTVGVLAVDVLNELFAGTLEAGDISNVVGAGAAKIRAGIVGGKFRDALIGEFVPGGTVTPQSGYDAAATFSGFAVNFAVGTAFVAILADALSFGHFEQFREMGVAATRNLGLGRMQARAWRSLIDEIVAKPAQRYVLQKYRTTILGEAEIVNLTDAGLLDEATATQWLAWLGYPDTLMEPLFQLHRKRLDDASVERLTRYGLMTKPDAVAYLVAQGFPPDIAALKIADFDLARADHWMQQKASAAIKAYVDGLISQGEFVGLVGDAHLGPATQEAIIALAGTLIETPRRALTETQAQTLLVENLIDLDQFDTAVAGEGYAVGDAQLLQLLALIKAGRAAEAQKVALYRWQVAVAKAEAKGLPPPPKPPLVSNP